MVKDNSGAADKRNLNATLAKMHAIYGKRLKSEDYSAMLSCTTVADAAPISDGFLRILIRIPYTEEIWKISCEGALWKYM